MYKLEHAKEIWNRAIAEYNPVAKYALFSGGHDSLSVTAFAMEQGADAAVHINTGIGIEDTREFVRETCKREGWPLKEYHGGKPYKELVREHGFPGPGAHLYMYSWLKERGRGRKKKPSKAGMLCTDCSPYTQGEPNDVE